MARLTIDGKRADASERATVLDAARQVGIEIPTLCRHPSLAPVGACRLCVVEVEGPALAKTVLSACTLPASDGLVVETDTERLRGYRKTIVQLLVSSVPPSEALAQLARRFGVDAPPSRSDGPSSCALCGLCVRVCRDRIGAQALALRGDGRRRVAERVVLDPAACTGCGSCAALCPVGAIAVEVRGLERRILLYGAVAARLPLDACTTCGRPDVPRPFRELVRSRLDPAQLGGSRDLCPTCAREHRAAALSGTALALQDGRS